MEAVAQPRNGSTFKRSRMLPMPVSDASVKVLAVDVAVVN